MDVSHIIQKDKEIHLKIFVRSKIALVQSAEWFQDTNTGVLIKEKFRIFPYWEKMFSSGLKPMSTFVTMKRVRLEALLKHLMAFLMQTGE